MPLTPFQEKTIAKLNTLKKTVIGDSGFVGYDGYGNYSITQVPEGQKANLMLLLTRIVRDGQSKEVTGYTTPAPKTRSWHRNHGFNTSVFVRGRAIDVEKLNAAVARIEHPLVAQPEIGCELPSR